MLSENIERIQGRMAEACSRSGRDLADVRLMAVSKKKSPEQVAEVHACGLDLMGENKVQEAKQKIPLCPGGIEWHLIGHLQTNKVKLAVRLFSRIHSVDSLRLLQIIDQESSEAGLTTPVCLEVNVSGERSKFGIPPAEVGDVLKAGNSMMNVDILGLMTMPPFTEDPEGARPFFRQLRELRDQLSDSGGMGLPELSMGMSSDFEVAIEEGATMVRVGTSIFGGR
jgi:pyridoxal phosphate enzyme (YggS family)